MGPPERLPGPLRVRQECPDVPANIFSRGDQCAQCAFIGPNPLSIVRSREVCVFGALDFNELE